MKNKLTYILLFMLLIPAFWWLIGSGYFNMHDDLQVMRFFQMNKCFMDGQIPCRWSPDMVWGYGQPMFNFYSAFPYYFGTFIHFLFSLNYLSTVKLVFLFSFVVAGIGMYKLAREFWGRTGGLLSAILYTYAPYHALDIYVRGAMSETYALSLLPWMWYFLYKLITKYSLKYFIGSSIAISLVLSSHNISTMLYAPVTAIWCLHWIFVKREVKPLLTVISAGILGIGLASFFIIPAVFEQNIIQTQFLTSDYSDFRGHFVTLRQLFVNRSWGDGPSIYGDREDISFQIGWPHWWLGGLAVVNALYLKLKKKIDMQTLLFVGGLSMLWLFFAFMAHHRSQLLWESIPKLEFVQFPWRFLGLVIFFLSFVGGSVSLSKNVLSKIFILFCILLTIALNYRYMIPVNFSRMVTEDQKLTGLAFELQQKAAILDYLPKTAKFAPNSKAFEKPQVLEGDASVGDFHKNSYSFSFDADVYLPSRVEIPVMYFPGWKVYVDDKESEIKSHGDYGLIEVALDEGRHTVFGKFTDTPVRSLANSISLISFGVMVVIISFEKNHEKKDNKSV